MKKEKDLSGTVIKLKKDQLKAIVPARENITKAEVLMTEGAGLKQKSGLEIWTMLRKFYPQIKEYQCTTNGKEIVINSKLGALDRAGKN